MQATSLFAFVHGSVTHGSHLYEETSKNMKMCLLVELKVCLFILYKVCAAGVNIGPVFFDELPLKSYFEFEM